MTFTCIIAIIQSVVRGLHIKVNPEMYIAGSFNIIECLFWSVVPPIFLVAVLDKWLEKLVPLSVKELMRYGRFNFTKIETNSIINKFQVPKSWFAHFYLFAAIFHSILFYTVLSIYMVPREGNSNLWLVRLLSLIAGVNRLQTVDATTTILVTFLFLLHVYRRFYETQCVSVFSNTKFNGFVYLGSYLYYFFVSLSLIAHSPVFCFQPGEDLTMTLKHLTINHLVGIPIVLHGFHQQYIAHLEFANLRKGKDKKVVSHKHYIPNGGLFNLVSSPNYWAEMVIYVGFVIIFKFQNPSFNAVTAYVIVSQIFTGLMNHQWYVATFPDYPRERKAVIPYVL